MSRFPRAHQLRHFESYGKVRLAKQERVRLQHARAEREHDREVAVFGLLKARDRRWREPDLQLVVPSGHGRSIRLSRRRRRAYAAHLAAIIAAAFEQPPPPSSPPDQTTSRSGAIAGRLCGVCGGGCCADGGERAYLSEATIRRVRAHDPAIGPDELHAAYLARLCERTRANSCINHTRAGCSLPRALRSDICNTFACASLTRLQSHAAEDRPLRTVAVLRRRQNLWNSGEPGLDNGIVGGVLISESSSEALRLPPSSSTSFEGRGPAG